MVKERATRKETFAVASKIKEYVRSKGFCASADLPDAVSAKVVAIIDAAIQHTENNGRKTVRGDDIV